MDSYVRILEVAAQYNKNVNSSFQNELRKSREGKEE